MADEQIDISEKIAEQIEKIAKESLQINIEVLKYIKEDLGDIKRVASERGIPTGKVLLLVADGIKKGLIRSGKVSAKEIKKIIDSSKEEFLRVLEKKRHKKREG